MKKKVKATQRTLDGIDRMGRVSPQAKAIRKPKYLTFDGLEERRRKELGMPKRKEKAVKRRAHHVSNDFKNGALFELNAHHEFLIKRFGHFWQFKQLYREVLEELKRHMTRIEERSKRYGCPVPPKPKKAKGHKADFDPVGLP